MSLKLIFGLVGRSGIFDRGSVHWGRFVFFVFGIFGFSGVFDVGDVTVTISLVGDGLNTTVWQSDVVRSRNYLSIARLLLSKIVVVVVVLNVIGVVVRLGDL
jgi:hypothetical protein